MGGRIGYADNPGGGSVYWLELPADDTIPVTNQLSPHRRQPPPGSAFRVLVVDDEPLNRNIARGFLRPRRA